MKLKHTLIGSILPQKATMVSYYYSFTRCFRCAIYSAVGNWPSLSALPQWPSDTIWFIDKDEISTYWVWYKIVAIIRMTFQIQFLERKIDLESRFKFESNMSCRLKRSWIFSCTKLDKLKDPQAMFDFNHASTFYTNSSIVRKCWCMINSRHKLEPEIIPKV